MRNVILILALAAGLVGCAMNDQPLEPDFGRAVKQNLNAQITDPDARYARTVEPSSDGTRTSSAQKRYQTGKVTPLPNVATTTIRSGGGGGN